MLNAVKTLLSKIVEVVKNPETEVFLIRLALLILLTLTLVRIIVAELR